MKVRAGLVVGWKIALQRNHTIECQVGFHVVVRLPAPGRTHGRQFRGRRVLQKKLAGYAVEMGYIKARPAIAS